MLEEHHDEIQENANDAKELQKLVDLNKNKLDALAAIPQKVGPLPLIKRN